MRSHTIRLSKPERLKIKKRMAILMKTKFKMKHESSPSRKQYSGSAFNSQYMIPYPHFFRRTQREIRNGIDMISEYPGIPKRKLNKIYICYYSDGMRHRDSYMAPSAVKLFSIRSDSEEKYVFEETSFTSEDKSCKLILYVVPFRFSGSFYNSYIYRREIRIRFKPNGKLLSIKTTLDADDYEPEKILDVINMGLYNVMTY